MSLEPKKPLIPGEIASQICRLIEIHPVTLKMTPAQISEVRAAREQELKQIFADHPQQDEAEKMLQMEQHDEERRWRFAQIRVEADELWLPVQSEDLLSGYIPIPPMKSKGSTAEIWVCQSRFAEKTQVVKLITDQAYNMALAPALALNEIQNHYQISHPNIVRIFEAGRLRTNRGDFPFVAMEELSGITLTEWISTSFITA